MPAPAPSANAEAEYTHRRGLCPPDAGAEVRVPPQGMVRAYVIGGAAPVTAPEIVTVTAGGARSVW